jgi:hypothetical protein
MSSNYFAPRTPIEIKLVKILEDCLSKKKIGIFDNFLEFGEEKSVLAKNLVSKIIATFGVELSTKDVVSSPTVFQVAKKISKNKYSLAERTVRSIVVPKVIHKIKRTTSNRVMSIGQKMIITAERTIKKPIYSVPFMAHLFGELNVSALERAINKIVERYENLRSIFKDYEYVIIKENVKVKISVVEGNKTEELISNELKKRFDLQNGPLIRVSLLRRSKKHHVCIINVHHIVFDLVSLYIFLLELSELYGSYVEKRVPRLEKVEYQFSDFSDWQIEYLSKNDTTSIKEFWKKQLKGIPHALEFPTDKLRKRKSFDGETLHFGIRKSLSEKVQKYCVANNIGYQFIVYLSVYQILLSKYSRQKNFAVGVAFTGRHYGNVEKIIGFLVNVLPFPVRVEESSTFDSFVRIVNDMYYSIYKNQDLPFEKILNLIRCERSMSKFENPLFQFVFNVITGINNLKSKMKGLVVEEIYPNVLISKFNITMTVYEKGGQVRIGIEYSTDLFKKETIVGLFKYYYILLERLLDNPKREIRKVSLLPKEEFDKQVFEWNRRNIKKYQKGTFKELFEKTVNENPSSIAVEFEDKTITYQELNSKSNIVAHLLIIHYKIKPGDFVAISVERSIDLIVYMIGIIKSGGVFFPLDPTYPKERLNFMINDAKPPLLIINSKFSSAFEDFVQEKKVIRADNRLLIISLKSGTVYKKDIL